MNDRRHDDFDGRMRALHAHALEQVPSRTLYELQVRRANAAASTAARARPGRAGSWWLAAGFAAAFALAIGLRQPGVDAPGLGKDAPSLAVVSEAAQAAALEDSLATLEEDPDLLLWLASQDRLILAME